MFNSFKYWMLDLQTGVKLIFMTQHTIIIHLFLRMTNKVIQCVGYPVYAQLSQ